jgi:hypothetical protein
MNFIKKIWIFFVYTGDKVLHIYTFISNKDISIGALFKFARWSFILLVVFIITAHFYSLPAYEYISLDFSHIISFEPKSSILSFVIADRNVYASTQIQEEEIINVVYINTALLTKYNSPLIPELNDCLAFGKQKCLIALAISGNESHFGQNSAYYNAFGWNCKKYGIRFSCGWQNWHEGVNEYMKMADGYLSMFNGTKQSILNIAHRGYYSDAVATEGHQQQWVDNVWSFYLELQK